MYNVSGLVSGQVKGAISEGLSANVGMSELEAESARAKAKMDKKVASGEFNKDEHFENLAKQFGSSFSEGIEGIAKAIIGGV